MESDLPFYMASRLFNREIADIMKTADILVGFADKNSQKPLI